jgi:hypothetical protein
MLGSWVFVLKRFVPLGFGFCFCKQGSAIASTDMGDKTTVAAKVSWTTLQHAGF